MASIKKSLTLFFLAIILLASCSSQNNESIRFAFFTDIHISEGAESSEYLAEIIQEVNHSDLEMVIISGDISNRGTDRELIYVKNHLDQLQIPYHIIPGNHEMNWSESAGLTFKELWGDDKFMFRKGRYLFAGINTGPFMRMGDGHVKREDIRWLKQQLREKMDPETILLFFAHYPLAEGLDQWYEITDILNSYSGVITFCGHGHQQQLLNAQGIPAVMGRSQVLRGENIPGYNIIEMIGESIFIFDKIAGQPLSDPGFSFSATHTEFLSEVPVSPLPDYTVNERFEHIRPVFAYTDSASVFTGVLTIDDSLLAFGNSQGEIKLMDINTQNILWTKKLTGPLFSTPALYKNIIIAGATDGLYAMDLDTGSIIWKLQTTSPVFAQPLIAGDYAYIGIGTQGFYKIDPATGEVIWVFDQTTDLLQAKAAIEGNNVVFTAWDTHIYCLDKFTGELQWMWNNQRPVELLSPGNVVPVIANNKVFIVAPDRYMTALDLQSGKEIWRTNKHQVRESQGISQDGNLVFAKLMNDTVIAVDTRSRQHKTVWALDAEFGYDHNPVPVVTSDKMLYTATRNGLIIAINIEDENVNWKHKAGNSAINFMHIDKQNRLWMSTADGQIIALPAK